jgi:hypothetical protein
MDTKGRTRLMAISYPPIFVNRYLQQKIGIQTGFGVPMLPSYPTDPDVLDAFTIDDLTEGDTFSFNGNLAIYDRMFKYRRTPFPHIKSEQLLYYFNASRQNAVDNLVQISQTVYDWLDREDESAQELNDWVRSLPRNPNGTISFGTDPTQFKPVFFHKIKVYQLEETRDIIDFGTARTYAGNKIIVDYDYHQIEIV